MAPTDQVVTQALIVPAGSVRPDQVSLRFSLFNEDGTPYVYPEQQAAIADQGALGQAAISGGEPPTEAEFNNLRTDLNNLRTKTNAILAALRNANIIAT